MDRSSTLDKSEKLKLRNILSKAKISLYEYELIVKLLEREPNENEIYMFGAMWSEHCAYKNSKPLLKLFPTTSNKVKILAGPGENAGIIDIGEGIKIAFKIESHNRPTAIEPFQGATTGVGGILRDILTLGARPIAFLNSLFFGSPTDEKSYYLLTNAIAGIGHYGNCTGIPTIGGQLYFDETYKENPLVNAMCIGLLETENPIPSGAIGIGNPIIYVGSETGKDGLGGAAFASSGLTEKSNKDRPAVQIGDPFLGKLLIESCLEAFKSGFVLASQDMGAAGLTCAFTEMSAKGEVGFEVNLDLVPTRGKLETHEYLLSESQERMLLVAQAGKEAELIKIFEKYNLPAVVIGKVTDTKLVTIYHRGEKVVEVPPKALTDQAPIYLREAIAPKNTVNILGKPDLEPKREIIEKLALNILSSDNSCSRAWIYKQFDQEVQLNTILKPGMGSGALLRLKKPDGKYSKRGLAISVDGNPNYVKSNPFLGAQIAVAEAARNIACIGAEALAITNNLNFGNPEKPESFWFLQESVKGIAEGCKQLELAVTGGNVSLYNEFADGQQILPTPVIGMVGVVEDYKNSPPISFRNAGDNIWLIGETFNETDCPKLDWNKEKALYEFLIEQIKKHYIHSAHDLSENGLLLTLMESVMASSNKSLGAEINLNKDLSLRLDSCLIGESQSRALITAAEFIEFESSERLKIEKIGKVINNSQLIVKLNNDQEIVNLSADTMKEANDRHL